MQHSLDFDLKAGGPGNVQFVAWGSRTGSFRNGENLRPRHDRRLLRKNSPAQADRRLERATRPGPVLRLNEPVLHVVAQRVCAIEGQVVVVIVGVALGLARLSILSILLIQLVLEPIGDSSDIRPCNALDIPVPMVLGIKNR